MNLNSYQTNHRASAEECVAIGDFIYDEKREWLYLVMPNATGHFSVDGQGRAVLEPIRISRTPSKDPRTWHWDGNEDRPTLTPSIHRRNHWHGYLTDGVLRSC